MKKITQKYKATLGFTLIEVMIVVAIVAILAAVAFANYSSNILRANRSDARETLTRLADQEERFFLANRMYSDNLMQINAINNSTEGNYNITYVVNMASGVACVNNQCYTLTANTDCASMTIDNLGRKSAINADGAINTTCWNR